MNLLAGVFLSIGVSNALAADLAIVGAKVFPAPDAEPIPNAVILIRDGMIVSVGPKVGTPVPSGYEVLERPGKVVTAGFWNSHVHLTTPALLNADTLSDEDLARILETMFTRWGFTTVFDLASTMESANAIRHRVSATGFSAPQILTVGDPFYPRDGTPVYAVDIYRKHNLPSAEIVSTESAVARLSRQVEAGADGIKLFTGAIVGGEVGVLPMPAGQVRALTSEAHRLGRVVFAHPTNQAGFDLAVDNGVDILAHAAPLMGPWPTAIAERLAARRIALIPTLTLFAAHPDPRTPVEVALQQVRALHQAGGDILFGTDGGFIDVFDTTQELQLMARVLDWRAILASLTTTPARRFGQEKIRGRIESGLAADIVILDRGPTSDGTAFASVHETIRNGEVIFRRGGE